MMLVHEGTMCLVPIKGLDKVVRVSWPLWPTGTHFCVCGWKQQ